MLQIAIVNGPNLNLVGTREVEVYGIEPMDEFIASLSRRFPSVSFHYQQSNVEGELVNYMQSCRGKVQGIILNGGGYTHTSIALADAISAVGIPTVEVHISNIHAREEYRKHTFTTEKCIGCITGLGLEGYALAVQYFISKLSSESA